MYHSEGLDTQNQVKRELIAAFDQAHKAYWNLEADQTPENQAKFEAQNDAFMALSEAQS